jgi:hypothetical protein
MRTVNIAFVQQSSRWFNGADRYPISDQPGCSILSGDPAGSVDCVADPTA